MFTFTLDAQCNVVEGNTQSANKDILQNMGDHYLNCLVVQFPDFALADDKLYSVQKALCLITTN
jgi:hypothetical protein